jgi:hypothetical protein
MWLGERSCPIPRLACQGAIRLPKPQAAVAQDKAKSDSHGSESSVGRLRQGAIRLPKPQAAVAQDKANSDSHGSESGVGRLQGQIQIRTGY